MTQHTSAIGKERRCPQCGQSFALAISTCPNDGSLLSGVDPLIGQQLDGLEVIEFIGQGGTSLVYKAQHLVLERFVAIKILKAEYLSDAVNLERFRREALAASRLHHPNVNAIHSIGVTANGGQPYLVLEFLSGANLAQVFEKEKPLDFQRVLSLFKQLCDGLAHAHEFGVIHRDLKPGNVVITQDAEGQELVKIVDFGAAKFSPHVSSRQQQLTQTGEVLGTLLYMSPEQKSGLEIDGRTDIYAVGYMLFEALEKDGVVPESVSRIIQRAMAEAPEDRFQKVSDLSDALAALSKPGFKLPSSRSLQTVAPENRRPKLGLMLPLVLVAIVAMLVALPFCMNDISKSRLFLGWLKLSGAPAPAVVNSADALANKIIDSGGSASDALQIYKKDAVPLLNQVDTRAKARIYLGQGKACCRMNDVPGARFSLNQINSLLNESTKLTPADRQAILYYRAQLQVEANSSEPMVPAKLDNLLALAADFERFGFPGEAEAIYNKAIDIAARASLYNQIQIKALQSYLDFCQRNNRSEQVFSINERILPLLEQMNLVRDPRYAKVRLMHGRLLQRDGKVREADILFQEVIDSLPNGHPLKPEAWIDLAVATKQRGRLDLCEQYLLLAADVDDKLSDPLFARLYTELGEIKRRDEDNAGAVRCFQEVYKKLGTKVFGMPECATLPDNLMFCLLEGRRNDEALVVGETAVAVGLKKNLSKEFQVWRTAMRVGEEYSKRRQFEKAKKYLTLAYEGADTNLARANIASMIGDAYNIHEDHVVAEQYYRKALHLGAESSAPYYLLLLYRCGLMDALLSEGRLPEVKQMMSEINATLGNGIFDPPHLAAVVMQLRVYVESGNAEGFRKLAKEVLRRREDASLYSVSETRRLRLQIADMERQLSQQTPRARAGKEALR